MHSAPGWQSAPDPWGSPGQLPVLDVGSWSAGRRGAEKAEVASEGTGWNGGAGTGAVVRGRAAENALDW